MASIYKRKLKNGGYTWRAVVRIQGHPTVCETFFRKQEAEDWALETEREVKLGKFKFERLKAKHTFSDLVTHYLHSGALEHHRSAQDTRRHLEWWKGRLGKYDLAYLTPELIADERQRLLDTPIAQGKKRSNATANRYFSSLSALLSS